MLKWLLKSLFILIALVVASTTLPFASVWLCRDPVGGQVFFWVAPWTCAFWSIIAYNLIGSKFWRGREAVEEWRARRGGYLRSVAKGTRMDVRFPVLLLRLRIRRPVGDAQPRMDACRRLFPSRFHGRLVQPWVTRSSASPEVAS
jgi:hypothetical protein